MLKNHNCTNKLDHPKGDWEKNQVQLWREISKTIIVREKKREQPKKTTQKKTIQKTHTKNQVQL